VDNKGEAASLEAASHVENLAKPVDCTFFSRSDDGDYGIHCLLFLEIELKALLKLGQIQTCAMVHCYADYVLRPDPSDG
jgi:hypothetical protein